MGINKSQNGLSWLWLLSRKSHKQTGKHLSL